jgi:hypothetical protein
VPYLYSADELAVLLTATDTLRYPLQRATYRTLISLLAVTGLFSGARPCGGALFPAFAQLRG